MTAVKSKFLDEAKTYPRQVLPNVYFNGFNSPLSYGANSWLITDESGNWMVDSPRFVSQVRDKIQDLGGLKYIFLTHQDDVGEAHLYAKEFGAKRIIHRNDIRAVPDAEIVFEGDAPQLIEEKFLAIPVPGHTKGHMVLLYDNKALFTGDHLELDLQAGKLAAFRDYCWYSWTKQTESMARLLDYPFEWIFTGHGQWGHLDKIEMHEKLCQLVKEMKETA